MAKSKKKVAKSVKKTITASQHDVLVVYQRMIKLHQDFNEQILKQVDDIVPDTLQGGGLYDHMMNDFDTLDEALDRLGYKVK